MASKSERDKVTAGSGNVFADLGFEHPEEELAKAKLVQAISNVMKSKRLTQANLAGVIGLDQPQVSRLLRGQTGGYSTDRLIKILNLLGQDVEIRVKEKPGRAKRSAHLVVSAMTKPAAQYVSETKAQYGFAKKNPASK